MTGYDELVETQKSMDYAQFLLNTVKQIKETLAPSSKEEADLILKLSVASNKQIREMNKLAWRNMKLVKRIEEAEAENERLRINIRRREHAYHGNDN